MKNPNNPKSPTQRRLRRQAEAKDRREHPDLEAQAVRRLEHPNGKIPKNKEAIHETAS